MRRPGAPSSVASGEVPGLSMPSTPSRPAPSAAEDDPSLVQGRDHLPGARQVVLRQQQRRHRRFPGATQKLDYLQGLGITCLWLLPFFPVAAARRWLRHRRLPERPSELRHARGLQGARPRRARAAHPGPDRAGRQSHLRSASVVSARAARAARLARAQVLRLERHRHEVSRDAHHLHRHREIELGVRPGRAASTTGTASSRISPTSTTTTRRVVDAVIDVMKFWLDLGVDALRLDAVPYLCVREGTNNENLPETHAVLKRDAARARRGVREPHAARRGEPVAGRRARRISATATNATWRSISR